MARKCPSVRSLMASTTPNAPYAPQPSRAELIAAIDRAVTAPGVQLAELAALLRQDATYSAWSARRDALRTALTSHYKTGPGNVAVACRCASCNRWRPELEALHDAKKTHEEGRTS